MLVDPFFVLSLIREGILDTLLKAAEPQPHIHHSSNNLLKGLVGKLVATIHTGNLAQQTVLDSSPFPGLLGFHPGVLAALRCEVSFQVHYILASKLGAPSVLAAEGAGCDVEARLLEYLPEQCISGQLARIPTAHPTHTDPSKAQLLERETKQPWGKKSSHKFG